KCCALTVSGTAAAAPPTSVMNSRRLIATSTFKTGYRSGSNWQIGSGVDVRFGSKADMCSAKGDVRYGPIADIGERTDSLARFLPWELSDGAKWSRLI